MRRKKRIKPSNTVTLALFFVGFVGALLIVSIFMKLFLLAKESSFDGSHRFTIAVSSSDLQSSNNKTTEIISFSPSDQSIERLVINTPVPIIGMERLLEIPIDGVVVINGNSISGKESIGEALKLIALSFKNVRSDLTVLDIMRLWWFGRTVSEHSVKDETFSQDPNLSLESQLDSYAQTLFADDTVASEKESISIVNGTDISGFGTRFSRLVTNMGGNVVSVSTSDSKVDHTTISYYGKKSYTLSRIEKVLGIKAVLSKSPELANIVIILGEDMSRTINF